MSTKVDIRSTSTAAPYSEYLSIFLATRTRRSSRAVFSNPISVVVYKESSLVCGFLFCPRAHQTHSRNGLKFLLNYSSSSILLKATSQITRPLPYAKDETEILQKRLMKSEESAGHPIQMQMAQKTKLQWQVFPTVRFHKDMHLEHCKYYYQCTSSASSAKIC